MDNNSPPLVIDTDYKDDKEVNDDSPDKMSAGQASEVGSRRDKIGEECSKVVDEECNALVNEAKSLSVNTDSSNDNNNELKTTTISKNKDQGNETKDETEATSKENEDYENENNVVNEDGRNKVCSVCGGNANGVYFGALVCLPCKSFYIRSTKDGEPNFTCSCKSGSDKTKQGRTKCQYCRYQQCLNAGMYRKEKPELVQIAEGQKLCKVCGDIANGIHFGIDTCEGCKKFFRRGIIENKSYVCKGQKNCNINPRNRNNCRYCRYVKCLTEGMSRDAIKMGRPKKKSESIDTGDTENSDTGMQNIDRIIPSSKESTSTPETFSSDSATSIFSQVSPCETTTNFNFQRPINRKILKTLLTKPDDQWKHMPTSMEKNEKEGIVDEHSVSNHLNTSWRVSCGILLPESKIPTKKDMRIDSKVEEVGCDLRINRKIEQSTSTSEKNIHPYGDDLDDILDFLESDIQRNQQKANHEHYSRLYDIDGYNKHRYIRENLPYNHSPSEDMAFTCSATKPRGTGRYVTRGPYNNDVPANRYDLSTLPDNKSTTCISDAPKIIFDYQHKHHDFGLNGFIDGCTLQSMDSPLNNFENETSTYGYSNRTTDNDIPIENTFYKQPLTPSIHQTHSYRSLNDNWDGVGHLSAHTNNMKDNRNGFDINIYSQSRDTFQNNSSSMSDHYKRNSAMTYSKGECNMESTMSQLNDQGSPLIRQSLNNTDIYKYDNDETGSFSGNSKHSNPAVSTHQKHDSYTDMGPSYGPVVETSSKTATSSFGNIETTFQPFVKESVEKTNTYNATVAQPNGTFSCVTDSEDSFGQNGPDFGDMNKNFFTPLVDEKSQFRINELFQSLVDGDEKSELIQVNESSDTEDDQTLAHLFDNFKANKDELLKGITIEDKEGSDLGSTKRKRDVKFENNQDTFLGYLKFRKNFKKNLICGQFNLEMSVEYWHKPVTLGTGTSCYTPVLQHLLNEYNKFKLIMDESKQEVTEDRNHVPWPKDPYNQEGHWNHVQRRILRNTTASINFFSHVPGYKDMNPDDRKHILNTASFAGANIIAAVSFFDSRGKKYKNFWNWTVHTENPAYPFKLRLLELGEVLNSLCMTDMEAAVMVALLLLSTDWCDLKDPITMEYERGRLIDALQSHLLDEGKDPVDRIQKLFYYMPRVRFMAVWHYQLLTKVRLNLQIQGVRSVMKNCHQ